MRPIEERFDPGRPDRPLTIRPKFIIVSEGFRTEQRYFEALRDNREIAGISGLIEIVMLQREDMDNGVSNPLALLDLLDEYMKCVRNGRYSLTLVLEFTANSLCNRFGLTRRDERLEEYRDRVRSESEGLIEEGGFIGYLDDVLNVCKDVSTSMFGDCPAFDPPKLIEFRPDTDRICVIVDRDSDDREQDVMDKFLRRCKRSGYKPYISNPCFELFLIMHFEEFYSIDRETLLLNPLIDGKRFTEIELDRIVRDINPTNRYDKTQYDPGMFLHRVGEAIECSMGLCHDPNRLKRELGTNLGELMLDMRRR